MRGLDSRLRYGGPWHSAASALPLAGGLTRPRALVRLLAAAVLRPRRIAGLITLLLRTKRESVVLSESCTGQALHSYFNQRSLRILPNNRLCRGVLLLPLDHADYLRGHRRQALRTNLRRAMAAGIRCEMAIDPSLAHADASPVLRRHWHWFSEPEFNAQMDDVRELFARPETTVIIARDELGEPLAVAAAVIDDTVCVIRLAVANCHEARWALHDHLVRILIARGVRYLLATGGGPFGALGFSTNLQHYQHLLGYQLRHVIPATPARARRRRRLAASLVVFAATASIIVPRAAASAIVRLARSPGNAAPGSVAHPAHRLPLTRGGHHGSHELK